MFRYNFKRLKRPAVETTSAYRLPRLEDVGLTKDEFIGRHRDSVQREMKQSKAEVFGSGLDEIILMNKQ